MEKKVEIKKTGCYDFIKEIHELIRQDMYSFADERERTTYLRGVYFRLLEILKTVNELPLEIREETDILHLFKPIPVFSYAYYGANVRDIIGTVLEIYRKIFEKQINDFNEKWKIPIRDITPNPSGVIKVCFVSDRLANLSSVFRDRFGLIFDLCGKSNYTVGIMTHEPKDDNGKNLANRVHIRHPLSNNPIQNATILARERYDIVVYCDLHMSDCVSAMSLFRVAPWTINTYGHSETGCATDIYATSELFELPIQKSKENYGEPYLWYQKSLGTKYKKIVNEDVIKQFKSRENFGFSNEENIYYCPSSLFKLGAEDIFIFKELLEKDNKAVIVVPRMNEYNDPKFYNAVCKIIPLPLRHRFRLVPRFNLIEQLNFTYNADVVLEGTIFGNLNTTYETLECNTPIVCLPTKKLNGRFTQALFKQLDLNELLVKTRKQYVDVAISIATNKTYQKELREKIKNKVENDKVLWDNEDVVKEWDDLFRTLYFNNAEDISSLLVKN